MSVSVSFYSASKKSNSTLRPTSAAHTASCYIKDSTSIYAPTFVLEYSGLPTWNLAYSSATGFYYWVNDIRSIHANTIEVDCSLDALATARSTIFNYSAYVLKSNDLYDTLQPDGFWIQRANTIRSTVSQSVASLDGIDSSLSGGGAYVIRTVGATSSSVTGISAYVCSRANLANVLSFMFDESNFTDVLADAAVKAVFNPFQYIVGIDWFPFEVNTIVYAASSSSVLGTVKFGLWDSGVYAYRLTSGLLSWSYQLPVPTFAYSDFRRYSSAYTRVLHTLYGYGLIEIPPIDFVSGTTAMYFIDLVTGDGTCSIVRTDFSIIAEYSVQMSVPIQIGQQASGLKSMFTSAASSAGLGGIGQLLAGAIGQVADTLTQGNLTSAESVLGNQGSFAKLARPLLYSYAIQMDTTSLPTNQLGRMVNGVYTLSNFSGDYVQCLNASVTTSLPAQYTDEINNHLNNGVFLE